MPPYAHVDAKSITTAYLISHPAFTICPTVRGHPSTAFPQKPRELRWISGMVVLGVSVVLISVSLLIYRHRRASWPLFPNFLLPWWQARFDAKNQQAIQANISGDELEKPGVESRSASISRSISRDTVEAQTTASPAEATVPGAAQDDQKIPSPQTTPKARSKLSDDHSNIPSFQLDISQSPKQSTSFALSEDHLQKPIPSKPSSTATPPSPSSKAPNNRTLNAAMLPPPRPSSLRPPSSAAASLRAPNAGPLPNRSPTAANTSSLSLPPSMTQKPAKPRQKVMLTPGHSPLDWARLQKSGTDLRGISTPRLIPVPPSLLRKQNGRKGKDAWSVWQGKVYNITPYLPFHPGGENELMKAAGRDAGKLFMEVHPWVNWENMLGQCLVGVLVEETAVGDTTEATLEQMD